jgi:hypothetical protein
MPYLLFYQIVPMFDMPRASTDGTETNPPSYIESKRSMELRRDLSSSALGRLTSMHRDELHAIDLGPRSKPPSIRLSADMDRPSRGTFEPSWMSSHTGSTPNVSRRESMANTDSPALTPGGNSPIIAPSDESTASRLSRAASRFALSRQSRPQSQSGEGRISFSMARLSGLMKAGKEPVNDGLPISAANSTGPVSDTSKAPDSPIEGERHHSLGAHRHKHRGKVKDKDKEKNKAGDQPERECTVM